MMVFESHLLDFGEGEVPEHVDIDPEYVEFYEPDTLRLEVDMAPDSDPLEISCNVPNMETAVLVGEAWYRQHPNHGNSVSIIDDRGNRTKLDRPGTLRSGSATFDHITKTVELDTSGA
jgi:hypothetical protein